MGPRRFSHFSFETIEGLCFPFARSLIWLLDSNPRGCFQVYGVLELDRFQPPTPTPPRVAASRNARADMAVGEDFVQGDLQHGGACAPRPTAERRGC